MQTGRVFGGLALALASLLGVPAAAQTAPSPAGAARYTGLHAAGWQGDAARIARLLEGGADPNPRDGHGRTPLHAATFAKRRDAIRALAKGGADLDALENDRYDAVTCSPRWPTTRPRSRGCSNSARARSSRPAATTAPR